MPRLVTEEIITHNRRLIGHLIGDYRQGRVAENGESNSHSSCWLASVYIYFRVTCL